MAMLLLLIIIFTIIHPFPTIILMIVQRMREMRAKVGEEVEPMGGNFRFCSPFHNHHHHIVIVTLIIIIIQY